MNSAERIDTLAERLGHIEDLAHDLAREIYRDIAVETQTVRNIIERIRTDADVCYAMVCVSDSSASAVAGAGMQDGSQLEPEA